MLGISDAHHFRKMVAGFCMMFAPLFMVVGFLTDPDTSYTFLMIGAILSLPAALGLMHMLREREVALGHLGGGAAIVGLMSMAGLVGIDVAGRTDLIDRVDHLSGVATPMFVGTMFFGAGLLALGMGLYRAHAAATWSAAFLMIGGIVFDVALIVSSVGMAVVAVAAIVLGMGSIGLVVWRESDDAWEQTPELA